MNDAGILHLDDGASVRRAAAEPAAFDILYDRYVSSVWNYVRYRVATAETTDDLTSEIFEKALRKLGSYDAAKGVFAGWLFAIARNSVRDHYRNDKRWKSLFMLLSAAEPPSEPDPIDRIVENDERR